MLFPRSRLKKVALAGQSQCQSILSYKLFKDERIIEVLEKSLFDKIYKGKVIRSIGNYYPINIA